MSGDVRISWRRYGNGPQTVLFVPTWNFVDSRVLRHQVDGLRDEFRVITYDARGSGESDHPATGYRFEDHVADARAVLDAAEAPAACVVASSLGTHVAVLLALAHPTRVQCVVLVAPPMDVPGRKAAAVNRGQKPSADPSWRTDYERFVPWFISNVFSEPDSQQTIDEVVAIALEADRSMLVQQAQELDWDAAPRRLQELRCPALVLHGTDDRTLDLNAVTAVATAIPNAQLRLLDGLGHRPDIRRPDIVNPILAEFLRKSERDRL
ncbi:MAG TPA: alpha/beta hydrolase [Candidatus Limnocylindrales bacterium]|nr:alpha/beta hydrolase [Candidatus Limnocylindrales bacterium]